MKIFILTGERESLALQVVGFNIQISVHVYTNSGYAVYASDILRIKSSSRSDSRGTETYLGRQLQVAQLLFPNAVRSSVAPGYPTSTLWNNVEGKAVRTLSIRTHFRIPGSVFSPWARAHKVSSAQ